MSQREIKALVAKLMSNPLSTKQKQTAKKLVFGKAGFAFGASFSGPGFIDKIYEDGRRITGTLVDGQGFTPVENK